MGSSTARFRYGLPILVGNNALFLDFEVERGAEVGELAVHDVEVRPADAAGQHAQPDLAGAGGGDRAVLFSKRLAGTSKNHCLHGNLDGSETDEVLKRTDPSGRAQPASLR